MAEKDEILFTDFYRQRIYHADSRWLICQECEFRVEQMCAACGCQIQNKTRKQQDACPKGKW